MPYRYRVGFWSLLLVLLVVPLSLRAQSGATAAQNKQLFDRAVDEINFRTMETVYDKSFTRRKFPVSLRTAKARREFDDFPGRPDIKQLFLNYNGVAERYKNRFGKGRTDLAEFEKQLAGILLDPNFEFFIRVLPRDERVALVRSLQRYSKQAAAQFNASEDRVPEELLVDGSAVPPADVDAQPEEPVAKPLEDPAPQPEATASAAEPARPAARPLGEYSAPRHDWLDYTTFFCSILSLGLLLYLTLSVVPGLRAQISSLTAEPDYEPEPEEPAEAPTPKQRTPAGLPEDRYDD
ncbi:hypothetical protein [Hymenobacter sp. B81]|uniref:hypothetical protein n=1 Tax=Hymenobacter sp. B81 TaxID=3344878 RepID=UPI0037DD186C